MRIRVILVSVTRRELASHEGHVLARTSGAVRILKARERAITYEFIGGVDEEQTYEGKGFYKPVAYVLDRDWDDDNRFLEMRPSQYEWALNFVPKKGYLFVIGLQPVSFKEVSVCYEADINTVVRREFISRRSRD